MKPGWRTTEFWATVAFDIGLVTAASVKVLPARYAAIAGTVSVAAYSIARGLAKLHPPKPQ